MKNIILKTTQESPLRNEISITTLRIFVGLTMAITHGAGKLPPPEKFLQGVTELGFPIPAFFAWSAGVTELAGGIFLAFGLFTRPAAFVLSFTMLVAIFGTHWPDPFSKKEMGLLYLFIFVLFLVRGGSRWSADNYINRNK